MNKLHTVQSLKIRLNAHPQSHQDLVDIFEDYKAAVAGFASEGIPYSTALRHTHEEYPDLQRLIGKGHDTVLKGRLTDALSALRRKIEEIEKPAMPEATADAGKPATDVPETDSTGVKPGWRNTPTLRMD